MRLLLDPRKHPFYEHSEAAFFLARRDRHVVGRVGALEVRPYNLAHGVRHVSLALFDAEDDSEAATALFARVTEWGRARGLERAVGPRGLSALDGYGVLVQGFDERQLMTMSAYNAAWYARLYEAAGFTKELDFVSYQLSRATFVMPDAVRRAAARAEGRLRVIQYPSRRALIRVARSIGETYNRAFAGNWEYYPLTEREIDFLVEQLKPLADHRLMAFIAAGDEIVGFLLAFPDVSAGLQRAGGTLSPVGLARLLIDRRRTRKVALNGAGILPEHQGRGGNALLYTTIEHAIRRTRFDRAELTQVAETATRMRADLERLGAVPIKLHRVYGKTL